MVASGGVSVVYGLDNCRRFFPGIEIQTDQLSSGMCSAEVATRDGKLGSLYQVQISQIIQYQAHLKPEYYYLTPIVDQHDVGRFRNRVMRTGMVNILKPGDQINHISARDTLTTIAKVHRSCVDRIAEKQFGRDLDKNPLPRGGLIDADLGRNLHSRIKNSIEHPDFDCHDELLEELTIAILSGTELSASTLREQSHLELFQQTCRLASQQHLPASLRELANRLDCSERTLNSVFHQFCTFSPKRYLRAIRLNKIRRELMDAADSDNISTIVLRNGIEYSGVFAAEYTKHFGEAPSKTFRKAKSVSNSPT
ncbi:MAG: helix-turn-helix domain-containing protein [Pirellulaceae bacterium]